MTALGLPLVGAYLHGSLAMGCYRRANSDLDLLIVVDDPLSEPERAAAARRLAVRSAGRPTAGDLELSVLTTAQAAADSHPRPFELHYSGQWTADILAVRVDYRLARTDPDLAAHIMVIRSRGAALLGPPGDEVFAPVRYADYVTAITADLADALDALPESPDYAVLNACRVLAVLANGPGTVVSKEEGAAWALGVLPPRHRQVVVQALGCYRGEQPPERWDATALREFADHMRSEVAARPSALTEHQGGPAEVRGDYPASHRPDRP